MSHTFAYLTTHTPLIKGVEFRPLNWGEGVPNHFFIVLLEPCLVY